MRLILICAISIISIKNHAQIGEQWIDLSTAIGYNPRLVNSNASMQFYPLSEFRVKRGLINTATYLDENPDIKRTSELLKITLPQIIETPVSTNFYLGYIIISDNAGLDRGVYITMYVLSYDSYSKVYIDKNIDYDFTNDGKPSIISEEERKVQATYQFLENTIVTDIEIDNQKQKYFRNRVYADTLRLEKKKLPNLDRYKAYKMWKSLIKDESKYVLAFNMGFGGGGNQEFKYSSINPNTSDYVIESFEFKRAGLGVFMGYEFHNIVLGINTGIEFWQTANFKRILKEGEEFDQFGAIFERQNALPTGYYYVGIQSGYNLNLSHQLIIQPSISYGMYKYRGQKEVAEEYNSNQENRKLFLANILAQLPVTNRFLIHAGVSYINFSFDQPEKINTVILTNQQELQLSFSKMSAVNFSFGITFRL